VASKEAEIEKNEEELELVAVTSFDNFSILFLAEDFLKHFLGEFSTSSSETGQFAVRKTHSLFSNSEAFCPSAGPGFQPTTLRSWGQQITSYSDDFRPNCGSHLGQLRNL